MKKVMRIVLVVALLAVTFISGCANNKQQGDNSGNKSNGDAKVKIRFASWSKDHLDKQKKLVNDFNASQDKIEVSLETYGDDYDTKITAGMGSKDAPDVMYMWNYPAFYNGLEPLDSYIDKEESGFKEKYYDALWAYNSIGNSVYGIPVGFSTHCLYYNKDLFDQAGIKYPTEEWTWDDLKAAAAAITEKCDGAKGFSYKLKADPYDYEMYLWSNGSGYVDKDGNLNGSINSNQSVEVLEFFQDMQKEGIAVATEGEGQDEMSSAKTAMFISGTWPIDTLKKAGLNFGIVEIPAFATSGQDSVSILSSSGVSISKDSSNKEAAWEFVKYWTGEELNKARIEYELPVLNSVVESEKLLDDEYRAPFYSMLKQSSGYTPTSFVIDHWSVLKDNLELSFERIFNPSTLEDVKTVLDEVAAK